jgi:cytochrome c peroxidase
MKLNNYCAILFIATIILITYSCSKDASNAYSPTPYDLIIPASLPQDMAIPTDNPLTYEGVQLGRLLFYDPILSTDSSLSCASCHHQSNAFVDPVARYSKGVGGTIGVRNSMALFNSGFATSMFWDGRLRTLEEQALEPIANPIEMKSSVAAALIKLNNSARYRQLFYRAFRSDTILAEHLAKAIAQFERTIISGQSKYDRYIAKQGSLDSIELEGLNLFLSEDKGDCAHCHVIGSTFTDFGFKNNGLQALVTDSGLYKVTGNPVDIAKFKTPTLRNIGLTAPYMHDGRLPTLRDVLDLYNINFNTAPNLDVNIAKHPKGRMTIPEVNAIIAFLHTLSDSSVVQNAALSNPYK